MSVRIPPHTRSREGTLLEGLNKPSQKTKISRNYNTLRKRKLFNEMTGSRDETLDAMSLE